MNVDESSKDFYITQQQWINRFDRWVEFFKNDCPKLRHILICLNKADLFCHNLSQEAKQLAYKPHNSEMNWQQRHAYVCNAYFREVLPSILKINQSIRGLSVRLTVPVVLLFAVNDSDLRTCQNALTIYQVRSAGLYPLQLLGWLSYQANPRLNNGDRRRAATLISSRDR